MKLEHIVTKAESGLTCDKILGMNYTVSRLLVKRIRLYGELLVDGQKHLMKDPVLEGQKIVASFTPAEGEVTATLHSETIKILFQDDHILVCSKPAHLVTHPTYLHHENNLTMKLGSNLLHPVNRLDRDTSGLVILAKNGWAHHALAMRKIKKKYLALVHGLDIPTEGVINLPIARAENSIMLREININGKSAITFFKVLNQWPKANLSLLEYELATGRTHQLRLHSLVSGWPIVGENMYGCNRLFPNWEIPPRRKKLAEARLNPDAPGASYQGEFLPPRDKVGDMAANCPASLDRKLCLHWDKMLDRQALHAYYLQFEHPLTKERLEFIDPFTDDVQIVLEALKTFEADCDKL